MLLKNYFDLENEDWSVKKRLCWSYIFSLFFEKKTYDKVNESIPKDDFAHQRDHFAYFQAV